MKASQKVISILLCFILCISMLSAAAFATETDQDDYENYSCSINGSYGVYLNCYWETPDGKDILDFSTSSDYYPDGLTFQVSDNKGILVEGTPNESGTFWVSVDCSTADHRYLIDLIINIAGGSASQQELYYNESLTGTVGEALDNWCWSTSGGELISNVYVESGALPDGLYFPETESGTFEICGTPTTSGESTCVICVETGNSIYHITLASSISGAADESFEITRIPTSVSVRAGGSALFEAAATNYSYMEWFLINDGAVVGIYSGTSCRKYSSCTVNTFNDSGIEYLQLENIPESMDGYTVQARFTNATLNESLFTFACRLTVLPALKGDVNEDESVNLQDLLTLKRYLAGADISICSTRADMDDSDTVNLLDLLLLLHQLIDPDEESDPSVTPAPDTTPSPSPTVDPTPTPTPSSTPTPTPSPTATPSPTPTPIPSPSSEQVDSSNPDCIIIDGKNYWSPAV